jgi:hypothetical protein
MQWTELHWTKWSWLAFVGCIVFVLVAWILFAPDLLAHSH